MVTTFKMAGLGPSAASVVTASADASALWACMTAVPGEFDIFPGMERTEGPVSASNSFPKQNGSLIGNVFLRPPPPAIQCLHPRHELVPITTTFWNLLFSHPEAQTFSVSDLFDVQNYITHFEVVPTITNVTLDATAFAINGAPVGYAITIDNTGVERTSAVAQAYVRQGSTFRAAGGTVVRCPQPGTPWGTLPPGVCTFADFAGASNAPLTYGNGDLVPGPAVLELHLEAGVSFRVLAGFAVPIVLN